MFALVPISIWLGQSELFGGSRRLPLHLAIGLKSNQKTERGQALKDEFDILELGAFEIFGHLLGSPGPGVTKQPSRSLRTAAICSGSFLGQDARATAAAVPSASSVSAMAVCPCEPSPLGFWKSGRSHRTMPFRCIQDHSRRQDVLQNSTTTRHAL